MRFKKGELTKEAHKVLMYDLEALKDAKTQDDFNYHFELLKGNIKDIFGVEEWKSIV